jgi:TonB family protein
MKKNPYIFLFLLATSALFFTVTAQNKNIPPPDKDILHDKEPVVIKRTEAVYPESMLSGGWEATVYLKAYIDVDGSVLEAKSEKIEVTAVNIVINNNDKSAGQKTDGKAFEEAAYSAVKQWKFSPAQMQGKPVAVWVTIPFHFKLSTKESKPEEETDRAEMEKNVESIRMTIENILKGTEIEKAKKMIGIEALLIYKTKIENLYSVLNGEHSNIHLTEGKERKCLNFNINLQKNAKSALIIWTSGLPGGKDKRVHSIFLVKTSEQTWKIVHWHVSW